MGGRSVACTSVDVGSHSPPTCTNWVSGAAESRRSAAVQRGGEDLPGHHTQLQQVAVAVLAHPQVDLRQAAEPEPGVGVEQQADLHAVPARERHRLQQLARRRVLPAQRLHHPGQLGAQRREQRAGEQLGDAPAAVLQRLLLGRLQPQRAPVEALDEADTGQREDRAEQRGDERGVEVDEVRVEEHDHVAGGRGERAPQHLALARQRRQVRHDVGAPHHAGARRGGHGDGPIRGPRVDDDELVDERSVAARQRDDRGDDRADGLLLVQRGQHDGHPPPGLRGDEAGGGPGRLLEGAVGEPLLRDVVHELSSVEKRSGSASAPMATRAPDITADRVPDSGILGAFWVNPA